MAYEEKNMSGALFRNRDKKEGSNQPDYWGTATIENIQYRLAGWVKQGKSGNFLSLSIEAPEPAMTKGNNDERIVDDEENLPF